MAQLDRCPDGLTMSELSKRMMVTGGNVTGITAQVEREGYVVREVAAHDRRVFRVRLTDAGRKVFAEMAAEHERWVKDLMAGLSEAEVKVLLDLLSRLKTHMVAPKS
jgi:DNA-binding MarR family transcriptional regulator